MDLPSLRFGHTELKRSIYVTKEIERLPVHVTVIYTLVFV